MRLCVLLFRYKSAHRHSCCWCWSLFIVGTNAVDHSDKLAKLSRVARVTAELHLRGEDIASIRVKTARSINDVQDHLAQALLSGVPLQVDELIDAATYGAIISAAHALDDTGPRADFVYGRIGTRSSHSVHTLSRLRVAPSLHLVGASRRSDWCACDHAFGFCFQGDSRAGRPQIAGVHLCYRPSSTCIVMLPSATPIIGPPCEKAES